MKRDFHALVESKVIVLPAHHIDEEVVHADVVVQLLEDLEKELTVDVQYQEKAEIMYEIVQPQTEKTLREITPEELKELCLNFKGDL